MKKQLLFFFLLIASVGSAQIVDIPDAEFKEYLLSTTLAYDSDGNNIPTIDSNNDNEIQYDEASIVWKLSIDNSLEEDTSFQGIEAFYNLRDLEISGDIVSFDAQSLINLEKLFISGVITSGNIWVQNLENLEILELWGGSNITQLDLTGLTSLKILGIAYPGELDIDFSNVPNIEEINFVDCHLLNDLDLSQAEHLKVLNLNSQNLIENLILGNKPELITFSAELHVESIDLSKCPVLTNLNLSYFTSSDDNPRFLNIKNGVSNYSSLELDLNSGINSPLYVCIDEGNESLFSDTVLSDPNIYISSYCDFTPGGDYNTITGNFTFDGDNNGCDAGDNFSTMVKVNINDGTESGSTFSNSNGNYNFYTEAGTFTLTPEFENSDWFTITPSSATVIFEDDNNNIETQNFCVTANGEHPDVEVVIVPTIPAQPGFNASYKITYRNKGNQTVSGNVFLTYDETVLDYVSSTSGVGTSTNTFGWSYTDLQPFETRNIYLTLKVNAPTDTPAVNIDDILMFTANVTVAADNDENPDDNTFILAQTVVGSFDPNDITCLEGEAVHTDKIGDYLHYNINFENTGTAPATFIVVKNEINAEQFDISTLQLLDASHNVEIRITGNTVEFYFGDINLAANGGRGNVLFKIKTLDTLQEDDIVMQEANIYFDYNFPIETNEANTTFSTLSSSVFTKDNSVTLYPNPSKDIVNITANTIITSVQLYDVQGRLLQTTEVKDTKAKIDISSQPSGLYFVKITTENGAKVEKLVKE